MIEFCFPWDAPHLNWQDLKPCAQDPDAFDNGEEGEEDEEKECDPAIDVDDDNDEKAGKGLRSSGSGKTDTTPPAAAEEPNTKPAQGAETKVEKKVDEQVREKDWEKEKVSDKKSSAVDTSEKTHDWKDGDQDKKNKADSTGTDLAKGRTDEKPKEEATPTGQGTQGSFFDKSKMLKFVQIYVPNTT